MKFSHSISHSIAFGVSLLLHGAILLVLIKPGQTKREFTVSQRNSRSSSKSKDEKKKNYKRDLLFVRYLHNTWLKSLEPKTQADENKNTDETHKKNMRFSSAENITRINNQIQNGISYPVMARRMGWYGLTQVKAIVNPEGKVKTVFLVESAGHRVLDQAVITAIKRWQFAKGDEDEEITLRIKFELR